MLRFFVVGALVLVPAEILAGPVGPGDETASVAQPGPSAPAAATSEPSPQARRRRARPAKGRRAHRRSVRRGRHAALYRKAVARWREPPPLAEVHWEGGYRDLTLYSVNWNERVTVRPIRADGSLDPEALAAMSKVLRDRRTGASSPVAERLVSLLYRVAEHFDAPQVTVISGYREPRRRHHSYHSDGAAIDFLLPGVPDDEVAEFARSLGRCGVGVYPTSGFVHLDVRDRSYFWCDASGPGQRGRVRQIQADHAQLADRRWDAATDAPVRRERPDGVQVIRASRGGRTASETPPAPGNDVDADLVPEETEDSDP